MRFHRLADWLQWQESLNPKEVDLGLERVAEVLSQLSFSADFFCPVISVAGTNGKGSTCAFIESILLQAELTVGSYTSPHLFAYNERIKINQQAVSDEVICRAFDVIDQVRGDIALTYFEFATLAALVIFKEMKTDVVVLEVGLGGRLDAVNVINADVSVITSIAIDHVDWLGNDVETIAREKAGIMRSHKPSIIAFFQPPTSLLVAANDNNTPLIQLGQDYIYQTLSYNNWQLKAADLHYDELPLPELKGAYQVQNAAAAIMATHLAGFALKLNNEIVAKGIKMTCLSGRYQQIAANPLVFVDVAHNAQAAEKLATLLGDMTISGKTIAVIAMLADKAISKVISALDSQIDHWISAGLDTQRGLDAKNMAQAVRNVLPDGKLTPCDKVSEACAMALGLADDEDRIIIFGSFYTVTEAIKSVNAKKIN